MRCATVAAIMIAALIWTAVTPVTSQGQAVTSTTLTNDNYNFIGAGELRMWLANNGSMSHNPMTDGSGLEWPAGSAKYLVYQEGLLVGGRCQGEVRVSGSTYRYGLQAGSILPNGLAANPSNPAYRVYQVRDLDEQEFYQLSSNEQSQLRQDFEEWPADDGAPFVDVNGNGRYEPNFQQWLQGSLLYDTPKFYGKEMCWYVANDLDATRSTRVYGSQPMGLEIQVLAWSSPGGDILGRSIFVKYTIINKSGGSIADTYISRWVDPDLGDAGDDFVGFDSQRRMMYCYNGLGVDDVYGSESPAVGMAWLQTPIVMQYGELARYGDGYREHYKNLSMSSFAFYINSDPVYSDPDLGVQEGAQQMYNYMQGRLYNGDGYIDPTTGGSVTFPLAGDPITQTGWVDGIVHPPDDRRMLTSCGPFYMAEGDTQEVVIVTTVGSGPHPLAALRELRGNAELLQRAYDTPGPKVEVSSCTYDVSWPEQNRYKLQVHAIVRSATSLRAALRRRDGTLLSTFDMFDDGLHDDRLAGDGWYGGTLSDAAVSGTVDLYLVIETATSGQVAFAAATSLPLDASVYAGDALVLSDHIDFNGRASPGESIVPGFTFYNAGSAATGPCIVSAMLPDGRSGSTSIESGISSGGSVSVDPIALGIEADFTFTVDTSSPVGTDIALPVILIAGNGVWTDTLRIPVVEVVNPLKHGTLLHASGPASATLEYIVTDPASTTDHSYLVTINGEDHEEKTMTVEDVTTARVLLDNVQMPDKFGHRDVGFDGIRLRLGDVIDAILLDENGAQIMPLPAVRWQFEDTSRSWFLPNRNKVYSTRDYYGSELSPYDLYPVLLVFDRSDGQKAYCYGRVSVMDVPYAGYFDVDVRAYDMQNEQIPRQIALAFTEMEGGATQDNTWMPTDNAYDYEMLFVFDDVYSQTPHPRFDDNLATNSWYLPALYMLWPVLNGGSGMFEDGDRFWFIPSVPVSNRDTYTLDMRATTADSPQQPGSPALQQNHPNPFGAGSSSGSTVTNISFNLERAGHVELSVYDALGRRVRTVTEGYHRAGLHVRSLALPGLPAGVYFYRLSTATETVTRRMLLLR